MTASRSSSDQRKYTTEAALTRKVEEWLELQPDIAFSKISDRFKRGISDLILCVRGMFVAIELKDDTGVVSEHQKQFIDNIIKRGGGIAAVCRTLEEVKTIVELARTRAR